MQMKNPPHPGELLGHNLAELGWSVTAAAFYDHAGISR
jgi:plasmid maintenance system antidote protein VapI